ncbi:MAG: NADPH:quinone oxidoreductase family protein [Gammaproteobacteria bacterium]|nr:MAG: NADPH:quinone oxidoreductase family protein [Gammaproteobacteria bacterium]
MKAVLCKNYGPPDSLVIDDIPAPQPADHEVAISVRACGVNFPDVLMIAGKYQTRPPMPFVPGAEVSGVIAAVGSRVQHLQPGQRVLGICGWGGMAEQACITAAAVVPIPDNMEFTTAAGFILTYGTAWHALKQRAALRGGESLLVLGAAGGVGLAAVELGRLLGAEVIAAASSEEKLQLAASRGAQHGVNYTHNSLRDEIPSLTDGRGADVIFDPVGGDLFDQCLRVTAWNGRILVIGFAGGKIQQIPANLPLLKGISIVGVFWGSFATHEPELHRENTTELLRLFERGELQPHISGTFTLDDAATAVGTLAQRRALGKVVVRVSD